MSVSREKVLMSQREMCVPEKGVYVGVTEQVITWALDVRWKENGVDARETILSVGIIKILSFETFFIEQKLKHHNCFKQHTI